MLQLTRSKIVKDFIDVYYQICDTRQLNSTDAKYERPFLYTTASASYLQVSDRHITPEVAWHSEKQGTRQVVVF